MSKYTPSDTLHAEPTPVKLCECGCGQPTQIAKKNHTKSGTIKGQPQRFIKGHTKGYRLTIGEALWSRCKALSISECWEWQGGKARFGYGVFGFHGKIYLAHRASYELHLGTIPEGMCVCHKCDNPSCCNPNHLFLGTREENNWDKGEKKRGRSARGSSRPDAKLTENQVIEIRRRYAAGHITQQQLGNEFGVTQNLISKVVLRQAWQHT